MSRSISCLFVVCAALGVNACQTRPAPSPAENEVTAPPSAEVNGLPAQTLALNECGLFVWSKTATPNFVFFAKAGEAKALYYLDDVAQELDIASSEGDIFGQFFTDLTYKTSNGREIKLQYEPGEDIQYGARISAGKIRYRNAENWLITQPVVGVRYCQPEIDTNTAPALPPAPAR